MSVQFGNFFDQVAYQRQSRQGLLGPTQSVPVTVRDIVNHLNQPAAMLQNVGVMKIQQGVGDLAYLNAAGINMLHRDLLEIKRQLAVLNARG